ncbi:MAG: hypothetical protein ABSH49_06155 [Bryobacteraceae bacterium]|jgi:hypothetical protein
MRNRQLAVKVKVWKQHQTSSTPIKGISMEDVLAGFDLKPEDFPPTPDDVR